MIFALLKNIAAGTRSALFMPVQLWSFQGGFVQVCLLLLVSLALTFFHDYVDTLPHHVFNPYGISYQGLLYFLFFFSLALIARIKGRMHDLDKLAVMLLSVVPVIWLGTLCLFLLSEQQHFFDPYQTSWLVFLLYSAWYLLVALRLFKRFFYLPVLPAGLLVAVYAVINFLPLFTLPATPLWRPAVLEIADSPAKEAVDVESVFYAQPALMHDIKESLYPSRAKKTDLYFLGFAGHAEEDVFMNEVMAAELIIKRNYSSYGRSALLINNRKTMKTYPLANRPNLEFLLKAMASKMDEEDILFLFISSHGNEQHEISTDFYPFDLSLIDPASLGAMLDEAGIRWRVIIVSACFSGGFINELANPASLLITASRHDRNSFGCGHDGRYTFFGDAFFDQGLKQGLSLEAAFKQAQSIIRQKEEDMDFVYSDPQFFIGDEMAEKLQLYEAEMQGRQSSNWARSDIQAIY